MQFVIPGVYSIDTVTVRLTRVQRKDYHQTLSTYNFLGEPTELFLSKVTFWKVKLHVIRHIMQFINESRFFFSPKWAGYTQNILNISLQLSMNALRHVNTGKHFFACKWVMSLDKNTGFLRFRLPVLLQQNLRSGMTLQRSDILHCLQSKGCLDL